MPPVGRVRVDYQVDTGPTLRSAEVRDGRTGTGALLLFADQLGTHFHSGERAGREVPRWNLEPPPRDRATLGAPAPYRSREHAIMADYWACC